MISSLFITVILCIFVLIFAVMGAPLFAVFGGVTVILFSFMGQDLSVILGDVFKLATAPALVAIPLFIFAGYYLSETRIAKRMLDLFEGGLGWLPGGLCLAIIASTDFFTAFTGATAVTIVAFGGLALPMLKEKGYTDRLSLGLITATGSAGLLFPPCIAVILYGLISQTDIRGLYIATFIPAILVEIALYIWCAHVAIRDKIPTTPFSFSSLMKAINAIKWEAPLAIFVILGIFLGWVTIDESAVVTVVYVLIVEGVILKEVKWSRLPHIVKESLIMLGAIFFILGVALSFTNYLVYVEAPQRLLEYMKVIMQDRWTFLIGLNAFLLVVGMLLDIFSATVIVVPLILPIAKYYQIDPFLLGAIFLTNLQIGFITPPVGMSLFISSLRFNKPVKAIMVGVFPFLIALLIVLALVTYVEPLTLFLPKLFHIQESLVLM